MTIRKLDAWVVESFRERAGRSLEEELRQVLTKAARERRTPRFIAELEQLNASRREK